MSEEKLSVRLEMRSKVASSRAHWAEVNGEDKDGFWKAFAADLESAAQLARRVEEAPVGHVDQTVATDAVVIDELDLTNWRLRGQRVRLVREEG